METFVESLRATVRWVHVFAAILWIGQTYLFNWFEKNLEREGQPEGVIGSLWMVHGGGFYHVEKQQFPKTMPRVLHWFKWEAGITWVSGTLLLALTYYNQGQLVEREMSFGLAVGVGIGMIVGGWVVYDLLVRTALGKNEVVFAGLGLVTLMVITYALRGVMSGRAVYIHVGAMVGTIMAANVWMRIIPAQRKILEASKAGTPIDPKLAASGPTRSKHNSFMVIPLVFIMISNHYPTISYGNEYNWAILGAFVLAGWVAARAFRGPDLSVRAYAAMAAAVVAGVLTWKVVTASTASSSADKRAPRGAVSAATVAEKPAPTGKASIKGTVKFAGTVPPPEAWGGTANAECKALHDDKIQVVRVKDGKLENAFVYVKDGLPPGTYAVPETPVVFDQKECEFTPRVFGIMAGQAMAATNSDKLMHNVKSPEWNEGFPFGVKRNLKLENATVMATIKCDVHPWMRAYAGVMEHPYFAVTKDDGAFEIQGLVDGEFTLVAWHEKLGTVEKKVKATEAAPATVELELK
jgi:uncharacterized membrane protein